MSSVISAADEYMAKNIIQKIVRFFAGLVPKMEASGLWLTDGLVGYQNLSRSRSEQLSLRLPPGIISGGKVQNQESLTKILSELRRRISSRSNKSPSIILTLPITNIYIQPFVLPAIMTENIKESAQLNMRMISPIEIDKAYYGWQQIGASNSEQTEMLGAFVANDVIDGFITCVQDAGYSVAAIEFHTLSLSRAAIKAGIIDDKIPSLLLQVIPEGLNFSVNHLGNLFFHRFIPWSSFGEGEKNISVDKFKESFTDEMRKIINFYLTNRKGTEVKKLVLVSSTFTAEIGQVMKEYFPGVEVVVADPKQVNPAVGAALRGLVPRSKDKEISLSPLSAVETFEKYQLANFLSVWRNICLATFGFVLLFFLFSALILQRVSARVATQDPFSQIAQSGELLEFEAEANKFNTLVDMVSNLSAERKELHGVIGRLNDLRGSSIQIVRINISAGRSTVLLEGVANDRGAITAFERVLAGVPQFTEVHLSLADIETQPDGTEVFSLTFQIVGYDF
ncbi:MAG: hypothetical protein PHV43_02125 [Candidatus Colwellbacteria bacterium]|nr:hypothetical protein [Candidatus Colwellbacteria bacterium]